MVDSCIGQGLTSHCHARNNLPETWASSTPHLISPDAYNLFIATTITEAFSKFIKKFKYSELLVTSVFIKAHLLHAIIIILTLQGIVISFMQLNEMFRYSLLHRRIIHTTLLFHRAFLEVKWSWLSCIHNNLWNGSWIVINSSFQSLVIHNITWIHLNAPQHCTYTYAISHSHPSYTYIHCITTIFIKSFQCLSIHAILHSIYHAWLNHD